MKIIIFLVSFLSFNVHAHECKKWEYSNLTMLITQNIEKNTLTGLKINTIWNEPGKSGVWINDERLGGNIKKNLKKYFDVGKINYSAIMNSIGDREWEAFSTDYKILSDIEERHYWYFKRCKN